MTGERYVVFMDRQLNEWQVVDIYDHEVVNVYHKDAKDRADQVAADLNEKDGSGG